MVSSRFGETKQSDQSRVAVQQLSCNGKYYVVAAAAISLFEAREIECIEYI